MAENKIETIDCPPFIHCGYVRSDQRIETKMGIYGERSQRGDFYQGFDSRQWMQQIWYGHRKTPRIQVHPIPEAYPSRVEPYQGSLPRPMWYHPYTWVPHLVSIITVTHNSTDPFVELLTSWAQYRPGAPCEWIVIDNASQQDHQSLLHSKDGQSLAWGTPMHVYFNDRNYKFTQAVNQGIQKARGEYFLLFNPDIVLTRENWLKRMIEDMHEIPGGAICGNKQLYPDGTIQHAGGTYAVCQVSGKYGPEHRGCEVHSREGIPNNVFNAVESVPWVTGSCMLIHRRVFIALGYLDEFMYPHYGSDRVYCEEARRHNFEVVYSPVEVIHKHGKSCE